MESPNGSMKFPVDKLAHLETANQVLREENLQLRSVNAAALFKNEVHLSLDQRYEESQSRFETIFYQSKLGNKIIAPDLRIMQINDVLLEMLGYTREEIVGKEVIEFAHPDFIHPWHDLQENLWTKQIPSFQIETCLFRKDGSSFWCHVTSIIFRDKEASLGYTIVEDISERKALELNLKKLYDYQETMMHMVAHDLKSPVNNIRSLSGIVKKYLEQLPGVEPEKNEQILSVVRMTLKTCDKADMVINDILIVGEFKSNLTFEQTDLKIFIESQLPILGMDADTKGITIRFHYPDEPVYAHINQDKFTRVLENLLSNAVKFTNAGGQVTISLKNEGQRVILQVSDDGIGIPEQLQASIFNLFTKSSRTGTEEETTTGLGLYIVKQIVEMHKGKIWVESQENAGTSFFIELM